jgi:hypothetical protein
MTVLPTRARDGHGRPQDAYCVGAAVCRVAGFADTPPFPEVRLIRDALLRLNAALRHADSIQGLAAGLCWGYHGKP